MRHSIALVLVVVLAGCSLSSKGDPGPPGSPGAPGQSVVSTQLGPGSAACPNGGSQFTTTGGMTYACNGAPGAQGLKGDTGPAAPPQALVVDAAGTTVGELLSYRSINSTERFVIAETWGSQRVVAERDGNGALIVIFDTPRFALAGCQGSAFTSAGPSSRVRLDALSGIYYIVQGPPQQVTVRSSIAFQGNGYVCADLGSAPVNETLRPMLPVPLAAAPVGPLDLVTP
jgi:hypothetical protein